MTDYSDLIEAVETDPNRESHEREIGITVNKKDEMMVVYASVQSVVKRLLAHDESELMYYETSNGDGGTRRVDAEEYEAEGHDGRKPVWSASVKLPRGNLTIKSKSRANSILSNTVSKGVFEGQEE